MTEVTKFGLAMPACYMHTAVIHGAGTEGRKLSLCHHGIEICGIAVKRIWPLPRQPMSPKFCS